MSADKQWTQWTEGETYSEEEFKLICEEYLSNTHHDSCGTSTYKFNIFSYIKDLIVICVRHKK